MKHSTEEPRSWRVRALVLGVGATELAARVAIPAGLWAIAAGMPHRTAIVSVVAVLASFGRGVIASLAVEASSGAVWRGVIRAAERLATHDLRAERKIGLIAESAREIAIYDATIVPLRWAYAVAATAAFFVASQLVGLGWIAALAAITVPIVGLLAWSGRKIRRAEQRSWDAFSALSADLRVLVEACLDLRAHERERSFAAALLGHADRFGRNERNLRAWNSLGSGLPAAALALAVATPFAERLAAEVASFTGHRAAEIAVVGGACVYFLSGLGRLWALAARDAPLRRTLEEFAAQARETPKTSGSTPSPSSNPDAPAIDLREAKIAFRGVTCVFAGARNATPSRVQHTWRAGRGLALVGANGAGKTTLALALVGLVGPTAGTIEVAGKKLDERVASALRRRTSFMSQAPFLEPNATVGWHMDLFTEEGLDPRRIEEALRNVGLLERLEARSPGAPLDVLAGTLSGGEARRMFLARTLARDADLYVLDEPEAGLDPATREQVRDLLDRLSRARRVLLIAHDPIIVPASFERLVIEREPV